MKRKRKKGLLSLILVLLISSISMVMFTGILIVSKSKSTVDENNLQDNVKPPIKDTSSDEQDVPLDQENIAGEINKIYALAKKGEMDEASFIVGKTTRQEVVEAIGEPSSKSIVAPSSYEEYQPYQITIGYQNNVITDIRSADDNVQEIHYKDIIDTIGEANQISYYKDENYDQIILNYDISSTYRLRWILDKPSESNDNNPSVDHISLIIIENDYEADKPENPNNTSISNMSLEEKIGQLVIAGMDGTSVQDLDKSLITDYHVGGFILYGNNLISKQQTQLLVNDLKTINKENNLPLFISVDQEGGRVSRLPDVENTPSSLEIGEKNDKKYAYNIGRIIGGNVKLLGFNLDYAPVLDINSNPNNPIIGDRSFGNNAKIVSEMGIEEMKGIQSEKVISVVKHFPGHGDTSVDSHIQLPKVDKTLKELQEQEMIPFKQAIDNGADVIMVAHILLPKLDKMYPASMSSVVMTDILRGQLKFNGVIITDDITMGAIVNNFGIGDAAVRSILAGSDIILVAHDYNSITSVIQSIKTAVNNHVITEERINDSVERIMQLKDHYLK